MLLFIELGEEIGLLDKNFKTSYVTVYLYTSVNRKSWKEISKHRMLLFIHDSGSSFCTFGNISKHRMLLFIASWFARSASATTISKHRMLLFILYLLCFALAKLEFQNIVCYCLSSRLKVKDLTYINFKTSYVTVYQK